MEKEPGNINLSELMKIANSTAGKELLSLVQQNKNAQFDEAMLEAQRGDFSQAQANERTGREAEFHFVKSGNDAANHVHCPILKPIDWGKKPAGHAADNAAGAAEHRFVQ